MSSWKSRAAAIATAVSLSLIVGCTEDDPVAPLPPVENVLTDASINAGETLSLDPNVVYTLQGFVFVEAGATLTIPAGTKIMAKAGEGENASALIIAKGGKININGTADAPVIMTSEIDDNGLDAAARGLWGGLIILGDAPINTASGTAQIEGIPATEARGAYGGSNPADNSGTISYLSVRYGGSNIGADNEINGVTFGGVGNGTTINNVEVINNKDDGFEFFGGTVNTSNLYAYGCGDDSFDWDFGFRGTGTNWVAVQTDDAGDFCIEGDGSSKDNFGNPNYSLPTITGGIFVGNGFDKTSEKDGLIKLREESGAKFDNCTFASSNPVNDFFKLDDAKGGSAASTIINHRFTAGELSVVNSHFMAPAAEAMSFKLAAGQADGTQAVKDAFTGHTTSNSFSAAAPTVAFPTWTKANALYTGIEVEKKYAELTDATIEAGQSVTLDANTEYTLKGFVFVETGATLTIPAGTVIKGKAGQGENASALIVCKGGKLYANGTAAAPIIMTAETDDGDLEPTARGLWGGLIILGDAPINTASGTAQIEGIPATEARGAYGGNNPADNSGSITYVSVRYGGSNIGADNEINGVTFGGVGNGTKVENIEVFNNKDDGFEWFGGTVNSKNLVAYGCGDDSFDWDFGFRGTGENWVAIQTADAGDFCIEGDGSSKDNFGNAAYSLPTVKNAIFLGNGFDKSTEKDGLIKLREESGAIFEGCYFASYNPVNDFVKLDDAKGGAATSTIINHRAPAGEFKITNSKFMTKHAQSLHFKLAEGQTDGSAAIKTAVGDGNNMFSSAAPTIALEAWTKAKSAFTGGITIEKKTATLTDASVEAGQAVTLDADTEYTLDGFLFVEAGATLTIPAGTVIKGKAGQGENASAIIICKGAKIYANGTAYDPIIMTSDTDDGDLEPTARGLWGGLIILGDAPINTASGTAQIEGIPATDARGMYGGANAADNSGSIMYVSVRYGGSNIGEDNEINGVTFGGVGNGTVVENIEVFNNKDDGFEWFGGTVNSKNLIAYGCGDDSFDWDFGFRGTGENWIAKQTADAGDFCIEGDGSSKDNFGNTAYSLPTVKNAIFMGNGFDKSTEKDGLIKLREESGAIFEACTFASEAPANDFVKLDDTKGGAATSTIIGTRFTAGEFKITGSSFMAADAAAAMKYKLAEGQADGSAAITADVQAGNTFAAQMPAVTYPTWTKAASAR